MNRFWIITLLLLVACAPSGSPTAVPTTDARQAYPAPPSPIPSTADGYPPPLPTAVPSSQGSQGYPRPTQPSDMINPATPLLTLRTPLVLPDQSVLTLLSVEDSRCPVDVVCAWAGELAAEVSLQTADGRTETLRLSNITPVPSKLLDGRELFIAAGQPAPVSTQIIPQGKYELLIDVSGGQESPQGVPNAGVYVHGVEVLLMESFPVQAAVLISGDWADGCTGLVGTEISRADTQFTLTLLTYRPADRMCTEALVPFTERVALDIAGLAAGEYEVVVAGQQTAVFKLDVDN